MKKLLALTASLVTLGVTVLVGGGVYLSRQLQSYPVVTFEVATTDPEQIEEFGLDGKITPEDWGFASEVDTFLSQPSGLALHAWFLPASRPESRKALVFVHGRWDNRMKALKYLPLLEAAGLRETHHVFMPDLRNSGTSPEGPTALGYRFAEDLTSALERLSTRGIDTVAIYAFSMGAMATGLMLHREDLAERMHSRGMAIEAIVMDSPLADVPGVLARRAEADRLPAPLVSIGLGLFNRSVDGYLPRMRLDSLLARTTIPTLIVQGAADDTTPLDLLAPLTFPQNVRMETFEGGRHVKMVNDPEIGSRYRDLVVSFLRSHVL